MEVWKDIDGFDGAYQVSNEGRIKSVTRKTTNGRGVSERILKKRVNERGYEYVCLQKNGKRKSIKVHRAVASAFVENLYGYNQVNHKDEQKTNNNADNLEWCDAAYNSNYGTGKIRAAKKRSERHENIIVQYGINGERVREWKSPAEVQKKTGNKYKATNIVACCRKRYKTSYGYIWRYACEG